MAPLGAPWGPLGASAGHFGPSGGSLGRLGAIFRRPGALLDRLGSWGPLGALLARLRARKNHATRRDAPQEARAKPQEI